MHGSALVQGAPKFTSNTGQTGRHRVTTCYLTWGLEVHLESLGSLDDTWALRFNECVWLHKHWRLIWSPFGSLRWLGDTGVEDAPGVTGPAAGVTRWHGGWRNVNKLDSLQLPTILTGITILFLLLIGYACTCSWEELCHIVSHFILAWGSPIWIKKVHKSCFLNVYWKQQANVLYSYFSDITSKAFSKVQLSWTSESSVNCSILSPLWVPSHGSSSRFPCQFSHKGPFLMPR